ncbi:LysR family transcriptional regulator [Desulfosporosinus sp.]|uniref:LysR family transcriptional regulator n=1 Tax=Desulfosporosinus sp. TaxID=157907 RepID=UPI0025BE5478|nr:LysR family transcriptional regulator [Desulfosporosinus sp.]MBC2727243.1 LysR family transcriptional regulator [Desulfosporosinus sp.]
MDIRQLRYFLAIAKEENITRAAKNLNMEQPPLSRQLKLLEEELGIILFERSGKKIRLTQAGLILQERAKNLLHQFNETMTEIKEIDQGLQGTLSIGSVFSCVSLLPPKIKKFHERYPRVLFKLLEGDHVPLGEYLEKRTVELVITRLPFESNYPAEKYTVLPLHSDPFVIAIPQKWDFPQSFLRLEDISNIPLLALKSDTTVRLNQKVVNECRRFGFEPNIVCECSSVAISIALVIAGIGAIILPKSVMSSFPIAEIKILDILDTPMQSEVGVIWLKDSYHSKSARSFIALFEEETYDVKNPFD